MSNTSVVMSISHPVPTSITQAGSLPVILKGTYRINCTQKLKTIM